MRYSTCQIAKLLRPATRRVLFCVPFLTVFILATVSARAVEIEEIVIENAGDVPLDKEFARLRIESQVGDEFDQGVVNKDVKDLQRTGRYSRVEVDVEGSRTGVVLTYGLESRPMLDRLVVEGADHLGNDEVRDLLGLEIGQPVDDSVIGASSLAVKEEYRKDHFVQPSISWKIRERENGLAEVHYVVDEGPRRKVGRINFEGNTHFSDAELRGEMQLKSYKWYNPWHWVSGAGRLEREKLSDDLRRLRSFYRNAGYLDVQIHDSDISDYSEHRLAIEIEIDEGQRYRIGETSLAGVTLFSEEDVAEEIRLKRGEWASQKDIDRTARQIREYFGSRGYIDTEVDSRLLATDEGEIDIEFQVHEGELARVRDIRIEGNRVTKDEVIRRELVTYPGEKYNEKKVRTSESRLRNLGYFERVASYNEKTSRSGLYDLVYKVSEQQMGRMSVGASFSSIDKLVGFFEISHGNFDLGSWPPVGDGQKINFRSEIGSERQDFTFSFTEPWFLDRRLALGFDLYSHESQYLSGDYDQNNRGASVSLTRPLGAFQRLKTAYSIENYKIHDVDEDASESIKSEEGSWTKSSLKLALTRDTRDNYLVATQGSRTVLSGMIAGSALQGDIDIYSLELRSSQHWNPWFNHIFSLRQRIGVVDSYSDSERVPIFDRFFLGGPFTLRGFDYRDVGPVDEDEEPLGGNSMAYASAEYGVPVIKAIRLATFYDIGMVWRDAWDYNSDINSDFGFGVRFDIPMFPIRLDYAWPIQADEHNDRDSGRFSFAIGHLF